MDEGTFEVERERLVRYFRTLCLISGLLIPGWLLLKLGLGKAIRHWVESVEYRLEQGSLFISSCFVLWGVVLCRQEKSIPLVKITDLKLVQGPLLNMMDLWVLRVQTASTSLPRPEAALYALDNPQDARDRILRAAADLHPVNRSSTGVIGQNRQGLTILDCFT